MRGMNGVKNGGRNGKENGSRNGKESGGMDGKENVTEIERKMGVGMIWKMTAAQLPELQCCGSALQAHTP